jgi:hypothetical protein
METADKRYIMSSSYKLFLMITLGLVLLSYSQKTEAMSVTKIPRLRISTIKPTAVSTHKQHALAMVAVVTPKFPFRWGPYTIKIVNNRKANSEYSQRLLICNAVGKILWETGAYSNATISECNVTGGSKSDLRILPFTVGHYGDGLDYYFSRNHGLHFLFSSDVASGNGISGFTNYDHASRPEMQVDYSISDFDDFSYADQQVFKCVYKWNGSQYINATAAFPRDALAAARVAKAKYLRHWKNNPKADYQANDETEGADSADRVDAIGYWANEMAIGQGETAKMWLLDHANPHLGFHLLRIEKELQKQTPSQGQPMDLRMGTGKNLDQAPARISSIGKLVLCVCGCDFHRPSGLR